MDKIKIWKISGNRELSYMMRFGGVLQCVSKLEHLALIVKTNSYIYMQEEGPIGINIENSVDSSPQEVSTNHMPLSDEELTEFWNILNNINFPKNILHKNRRK